MTRRIAIAAASLAALLTASACQDYNFNPVGHCVIQPGTRRVTLSTVSTADVLFVVDDSNSMAGKQAKLAANFSSFMTVLNDENTARVAAGLVPIDFHIAVTTTSNFLDWTLNGGATCKTGCGSASGAVCCLGVNNQPQPPQCKASSECAPGFTCTNACAGTSTIWPVGGGDTGCYSDDGKCTPQPIPCGTIGASCGVDERYYSVDASCTPAYGGLGTTPLTGDGDTYPMGRFMADSRSGGNPLVLNFEKGLYCNWDGTKCVGAPPAGAATQLSNLSTAFGQNVNVGTCGSGQEQGLEAARLAVQRVMGTNGLAQTTGYTAGEFLHPNAKLVVVWISDENDCSSPNSPAYGVTFPPNKTPSNDGCATDSSLPEAQQREYRIADYTSFFTGLGRPFGAAFIVSATTDTGSNACQDQSCVAATCTDPSCTDPNPLTCGGQWLPARYLSLAGQLRSQGSDVVVGSICDDFGTSLGRIAQIVKPPIGLVLPTQPAGTQVAILRIANTSTGKTIKTCRGPASAAPATYPGGITTTLTPSGSPPIVCGAFAAGEAWDEDHAACYLSTLGGDDWWFTAKSDQLTNLQRLPSASSENVYINHTTGNCEANPGETYSFDYLGQVPAGGCATDLDCQKALGGQESDWSCLGYDNSVSPPRMGTCVCN